MPPLPQRARLHFQLPHAVEREILVRELESGIAQMQRAVETAYPDGLPQMKGPGTKEERLLRYETLTDPIDIDVILDEDYIELFKLGAAPMPVSEFWSQLIMFEDLFTETIKDYRTIRKEFA